MENTATLRGHLSEVRSLAFSPDGTQLASGAWDGLKLWDVTAGTLTASFGAGGYFVASLAWSPDGTLASASSDGRVALWDVKTGNAAALPGMGHDDVGTSVAFSPVAKKMLASGSERGSVRLWDVETGRNTSSLGLRSWGIQSVAFSPDGTNLAAGSLDNSIDLWDVATRTGIASFRRGHGPILSLAFSPDGKRLAAGEPWAIILLDVESWSAGGVAGAYTAAPYMSTPEGNAQWQSLAFSPDGKMLASAPFLAGERVMLWDASTLDHRATLGEGGHVSFSPDGTTLAAGRSLWDLSTLEVVATLPARSPLSYRLDALSFSPDGTILASGYARSGVVALWDVVTRETAAILDGHGDDVRSLSFSSDGRLLASGSTDGTILVWDMQMLQPRPQALAAISGDEQQGPAGTSLAEPFMVSVLDQHGSPLAGVTITFAVTAGGGTVSEATVTTDADGRAATTLTLGPQPGINTVQVMVDRLESVYFTAIAEATPDFNGDGVTDLADFYLFAEAFGGSDPRFDLDGNGSVDLADFYLLAESFGPTARAKLAAMAKELIGLPDGPQLRQNAPNPFNSGTVITWFQLQPGPARLEVFALTGQRVAVLQEGPAKAGIHRLRWDGRVDRGRPLASGV